jgi:hypothetical protein
MAFAPAKGKIGAERKTARFCLCMHGWMMETAKVVDQVYLLVVFALT